MKKLILASKSPRRKELLALGGYTFEIVTSGVNEDTDIKDPALVVEELSKRKALDVLRIVVTERDDLVDEKLGFYQVIGADTIVAVDGEILGKPKDEADAFCMLQKLQGRTHQVFSGVTLVSVCEGVTKQDVMENGLREEYLVRKTFHEKTDVTFYPMTEEEIRAYIATGDPMDKAGAYGIQSKAAKYVKSIQGDYNNVVGLPLARLYHEL